MPWQPIPAAELREDLAQAHSDLYKEMHGIRPRWIRYDDLSTERIGELVLALQAETEALIAFERMEADYEARVAAREVPSPWMDRAAHAGAEGW